MITAAADDPPGVAMQTATAAGTPEAQASTGMLRAAIEITAMGLTGAVTLIPHQAVQKRAGRPTLITRPLHNGPRAPIVDSTRSGLRVKRPAPS